MFLSTNCAFWSGLPGWSKNLILGQMTSVGSFLKYGIWDKINIRPSEMSLIPRFPLKNWLFCTVKNHSPYNVYGLHNIYIDAFQL